MELKFCRFNKDCYLVQKDYGSGERKTVGHIDRSPMNPLVWMVDMNDGKTTGHTRLADAKKAACKVYKARTDKLGEVSDGRFILADDPAIRAAIEAMEKGLAFISCKDPWCLIDGRGKCWACRRRERLASAIAGLKGEA